MAAFGISATHPNTAGTHFFGFTSTASGYLFVVSNSADATTNAKLTVHTDGDVLIGPRTASALATTATDGFQYIRSCNGAATGTPTHAGTGRVPMVYDYANHELYIYHGAWRSVALT